MFILPTIRVTIIVIVIEVREFRPHGPVPELAGA